MPRTSTKLTPEAASAREGGLQHPGGLPQVLHRSARVRGVGRRRAGPGFQRRARAAAVGSAGVAALAPQAVSKTDALDLGMENAHDECA